MPKVSDEHKQRRREEILAGAQRAFARHGYEGATVARLEEETGLSRGAIFSYFENKEALFIGVVGRSSDRLVEIWLERGLPGAAGGDRARGPDWLSVQLEAARSESRTDERFREQLARLDERRGSAARGAASPGCAATVRDDMPIEVIAQFLALVANGARARARSADDELPDLERRWPSSSRPASAPR